MCARSSTTRVNGRSQQLVFSQAKRAGPLTGDNPRQYPSKDRRRGVGARCRDDFRNGGA